jgi:hypothetical protein
MSKKTKKAKRTKRLYTDDGPHNESIIVKAITEAAADYSRSSDPNIKRSVWVRGVSNWNEFDITGVISRVGSEKPTTVCVRGEDRTDLRDNLPNSYSRRMRHWSEDDFSTYDGFYVPYFWFDYYELVVDENEESLEDVWDRIEQKVREEEAV